MTIRPASNSPIFKDGKPKPGIYEIQNIYTETYLDIEVHSRGVHCRPAKDLREGRGLWEIKSFGAGYTVQFVGTPMQFRCDLCHHTLNRAKCSPLSVTAYPMAWRVEIVDDVKRRDFESELDAIRHIGAVH
ncbi:hypothetical protein BDM02DRAFT_2708108 [Thelephora ganbajun]|uniref:Uncharacterized protein n=1 Tax=Thelephora ganbajun TaxID=370292 RepID=A0ACB6YYX3_THEGA|nr:hypothetical protein BDM02DRAFT_2708108 [Thelephora ganbajun]